MATEMVRYVTVYVGYRSGHLGNRFHPCIDLTRTVDLHSRKVHEITIRSHPPDICEIGCRSPSEREHDLAWKPAAIDECQSDIPIAKKGDHSFCQPSAMAELDRESNIRRDPSN